MANLLLSAVLLIVIGMAADTGAIEFYRGGFPRNLGSVYSTPYLSKNCDILPWSIRQDRQPTHVRTQECVQLYKNEYCTGEYLEFGPSKDEQALNTTGIHSMKACPVRTMLTVSGERRLQFKGEDGEVILDYPIFSFCTTIKEPTDRFAVVSWSIATLNITTTHHEICLETFEEENCKGEPTELTNGTLPVSFRSCDPVTIPVSLHRLFGGLYNIFNTKDHVMESE